MEDAKCSGRGPSTLPTQSAKSGVRPESRAIVEIFVDDFSVGQRRDSLGERLDRLAVFGTELELGEKLVEEFRFGFRNMLVDAHALPSEGKRLFGVEERFHLFPELLVGHRGRELLEGFPECFLFFFGEPQLLDCEIHEP